MQFTRQVKYSELRSATNTQIGQTFEGFSQNGAGTCEIPVGKGTDRATREADILLTWLYCEVAHGRLAAIK